MACPCPCFDVELKILIYRVDNLRKVVFCEIKSILTLTCRYMYHFKIKVVMFLAMKLYNCKCNLCLLPNSNFQINFKNIKSLIKKLCENGKVCV